MSKRTRPRTTAEAKRRRRHVQHRDMLRRRITVVVMGSVLSVYVDKRTAVYVDFGVVDQTQGHERIVYRRLNHQEGTHWIRGHYADDSPEVQALLVAYALSQGGP